MEKGTIKMNLDDLSKKELIKIIDDLKYELRLNEKFKENVQAALGYTNNEIKELKTK